MKKPIKILLVQGGNLINLGNRQPELYGTAKASELDAKLLQHAQTNGYELEIFYAEIESEAVERIQSACGNGIDGLVMNPGGFTSSAYALKECLGLAPLPYVEVHITNLGQRNIHSLLAQHAVGVIMGFGLYSYILGLEAMLHILVSNPS